MLKIQLQTSFGRPPYGLLRGTIGSGDGDGACERRMGGGLAEEEKTGRASSPVVS